MSEIKYLDINGLQTFKEEEDALLQGKQETLVSGTNIKTINGESLLGSGDLDVGSDVEPIPTADIEVLMKYGAVPDPILENNSWKVIRKVCENGEALLYWSLGDTKTVTVNNVTYRVQLVHSGNIYNNKKAVFQFLDVPNLELAWARSATNDVNSGYLWNELAKLGRIYNAVVSPELEVQLTNTTVQVATSGSTTTLTTLTGPLFIPAEKELTATRTYSVQEEFNALTTFTYFANNDTNEARRRYKSENPVRYWLRSPHTGDSTSVCQIGSSGGGIYNTAYNNTGNHIAPCFAF